MVNQIANVTDISQRAGGMASLCLWTSEDQRTLSRASIKDALSAELSVI